MRGAHTKDSHDEEVRPLWKGVAIMAGIYVFFLIESFMKARVTKHNHDNQSTNEVNIQLNLFDTNNKGDVSSQTMS